MAPRSDMADIGSGESDEMSLFGLATALLRHRWRIAASIVLGAVLAAATVISKPLLYGASATFVPEGNDARSSGLAGLASQFGVMLPTAGQSLSPDFYVRLLTSRAVLLPIAYDTLAVAELGGKRLSIMELFEIKDGSAASREEQTLSALRSAISPGIARSVGVVELTVSSRWRSVSLAIAEALVNGVNKYNQRTREGQAAAERKFVEGRLELAANDLRDAEDRLERFLRANRGGIEGSPELQIERDRIQRGLSLKQGVFTTLTQAYEQARIREVHDMPSITLFEKPWSPLAPLPRGRVKRVLLGAILGVFFSVFVIFVSESMARHRRAGNPEADELAATWHRMRVDVANGVRSVGSRLGGSKRGG